MQPISANNSVKQLNTMVKQPLSLRFGTEKPMVSQEQCKAAYQKSFKKTAFGIALFTALGLGCLSFIDYQNRSILKAEEKETSRLKLDEAKLATKLVGLLQSWKENVERFKSLSTPFRVQFKDFEGKSPSQKDYTLPNLHTPGLKELLERYRLGRSQKMHDKRN